MAEMAAAAWAAVKAASAFVVGSMKAVAAGTATAGQVATYVAVTVGGSMAMSAAAQALMKPNVGGRAPGEWVADPNAGIPFAIGPRIGVGGNIVYKNTWGKDNEYKGIVSVVSGAGPITEYLGFTADKETVTFSGDAATGRYSGQMWMRRTMGNQPDVALSDPSMPGWGANYKLSGKASFLWVLKQDSKFSVYPQGEPSPIHVVSGIKGYDPRFDDTFPGGAGTCRLGVPATYRPITNPIIADLNWCLGLKENGKVVGGLGVSPAGIHWAAYTRAANIADANGWVVAALPRSDEPKSEVRAAFLQAGGAVISRQAGLISCVSRGAPKSPVMTISAADTAGPIELDTAANVLNRLNQITPRYLSEAHDWQLVAAAPVTSSVYLTEDRGRLRSDQRDYSYVPSAKQAAELAALDLANTREGIAGRWPLKAFCRDLEPGDVFTVDEPGMLLDGMDFLVLHREFEPATSTVYVTFVSETAGKVDWALGRTPNPPPTPALSARVDLSPPASGDWSVTLPTPVPGNVQVPTATITITIDNARAEGLIVEKGPSSTGPWRQIKEVAINGTTLTVPLYDLAPNEVFWLALSYRAADTGLSVRDVKGPFTAGDLVAGDTTHLKGEPVQNILDRLVGVEAISASNEAAVSDLEEVYGDTVSAAQSALEAGEAANLATLKAAAADGSASAANTSAGIANTKATEAGNSATAANASKLAAESARDGAAGSAAAAVTSASTASTKATEAGNSASAAEGAATTATTAAGNALTYRNQASSAKDDAISASVSAGVSAKASSDQAAALLYPFCDSLETWTTAGAAADLSGPASTVPTAYAHHASIVTDPDLGVCIEITGGTVGATLTHKGYLHGVGQHHRLKAKVKCIAPQASSPAFRDTRLDASLTYLTRSAHAQPNGAAGQIFDYVWDADIGARLAGTAGAENVRWGISFWGTWRISMFSVEVVTAAKAAESSAAVATAQAANASASASSAEASANLAASVGPRGYAQNPSFGDWTGALPAHWSLDTTNGTTTKQPGLNGRPNSLRSASSGADYGFLQDTSAPTGGEYLVLEAEVTLVSGDLRGSGLFLRTRTSAGANISSYALRFGYESDASGRAVGSGVVGSRYRFSKLVDARGATVGVYRLFGLTRYSVVGPVVGAATLDWHHVDVRPATPEEIAAGTVLPDVQAQLAITAAVAADSQSRLGSVSFDVTGGAGGAPFQIWGKAGPDGSMAGLVGTALILSNVLGTQVVEALKLIGGEAYFSAPVSVTISSRRLTIGPGFGVSNGLVMWFGPSSTAIGSMSRTNGYFALGTDGKVYYGNGELLGGTPFKLKSSHSSIAASRSGAGTVTTPVVTFTAEGATGPVSFDVYFMSGDGTIVATNTSSTDSAAPFQHQTAFSTTVTAAQLKTGRFICSVRDAAGNTDTALVAVGLSENT